MASLENTFIADTYNSVLHANGLPLPSTGQVGIYDGIGNKSSISLGKETEGATVTGTLKSTTLTVGSVDYPADPGAIGSFVYQETGSKLGYISQIPFSSLANLSPSPAQTYSNPILSMTVNSKGLITAVSETTNPRTSRFLKAHHSGISTVTATPIVVPVWGDVNDWIRVDLTNDGVGGTENLGSVEDATRAVTLFIRSAGANGKLIHGGGSTHIQVTPSPYTFLTTENNPYIYNVLWDVPNNSADQRGISAQFTTPVSRETVGSESNHACIYLRNIGIGAVNSTEWEITIVAQYI